MLQAAPRLALALGWTLAAAGGAPPAPAHAFGEATRQVLIEANIVVALDHDAVLGGLGGIQKNRRLDAATEASVAALAADAAASTSAAIAALHADPLASSQEGAASLVFLSIAAAENARLREILDEPGEPKAGKVAKPARAARSLGIAAATAIQGRPGRLPLDNALERSVDDYVGELIDLFPFLQGHGLPDPLSALVEVFSSGPKGKLVERAALVPGEGVRAKVKKDELELSVDGPGPVTGGVDLALPLVGDYAAYATFHLPAKLSGKAREALDGVSVGLRVATDASADPSELLTIEHQLTPDGWIQTVFKAKDTELGSFPHPSADSGRELVTFFVKDGGTVTAGALLRDEAGETLVSDSTPVLGELPVLGLFFRNNTKAKLLADDLIVYATPVLISEPGS